MKTIRYIFLGSAVVFILLQFVYYAELPEIMAVHFDSQGNVNGWMPKKANLIISSLLVVFITSTMYATPNYLNSVPVDFIHVPRKDYWFQEGNKERLMAILAGHIYFIGLATNVFMMFLFHQIFRLNMHKIDSLSLIGLIPYGVCLAGSIIHLFVRLRTSR